MRQMRVHFAQRATFANAPKHHRHEVSLSGWGIRSLGHQQAEIMLVIVQRAGEQ